MNFRFIKILGILGILTIVFFTYRKIQNDAETKGQLIQQNQMLFEEIRRMQHEINVREQALIIARKEKERTESNMTSIRQNQLRREALIVAKNTTDVEKEHELSHVRMSSIWQSYCVMNSHTDECKQYSGESN